MPQNILDEDQHDIDNVVDDVIPKSLAKELKAIFFILIMLCLFSIVGSYYWHYWDFIPKIEDILESFNRSRAIPHDLVGSLLGNMITTTSIGIIIAIVILEIRSRQFIKKTGAKPKEKSLGDTLYINIILGVIGGAFLGGLYLHLMRWILNKIWINQVMADSYVLEYSWLIFVPFEMLLYAVFYVTFSDGAKKLFEETKSN